MSRSVNGKLLGRAAHRPLFDELGSVDLTEREILVQAVKTSHTVLNGLIGDMPSRFPEFYEDMKKRLIENEKALADYDALNAVTDAQDIEREMYDFTPTPSDMPVIDFDKIEEIPF